MRTLVAIVITAACTGGSTSTSTSGSDSQSFRDGVQALCDLPDHVESGGPYDKRLAALATWAEHNITNPEAKQVGGVTSLAANKDALAKAVTKAGIQHCKLLDNGMELQSFAEAMKIICDGRGKDPAYFKSHLLNTEVVRLMGALGDVSPVDRVTRMREAMARAGLSSCALVDTPMTPGTPIPKVANVGLAEIDETIPALVITPTGIVVEGKPIVAVRNGDVDPAEKEGGSLGVLIPRLRNFAKALAEQMKLKTPSGPPFGLTLLVDPATPYRLLVEAMFSTNQAGFRRLALAVSAGPATKAIPIELPEKPKPAPGLGMVVAITKDHLVVWSISGQEGTLKAPKLQVALDHVADVQKTLAEIAERRWHGGKRADADRGIVVMADGATPTQTLADVLVAVRTTVDGKELFPEIRLASGFE